MGIVIVSTSGSCEVKEIMCESLIEQWIALHIVSKYIWVTSLGPN